MRTSGLLLKVTTGIVGSLAVSAMPVAAQQASARTVVLPYFGSAPETGIQYGGALFRIKQPPDSATRPSSGTLFASYTAKRQALAFAEIDRWSRGNDWHVTGHLEWRRFPLPFYGFGDESPDSAEEFYTPTGVRAQAVMQRRVRGPLYLVGGYGYQDVRIAHSSPNGALASGAVLGNRGGRIGQVQFGALWDNRDDVFSSRSGSFLQLTSAVAAPAFASDYDFTRVMLDARHFVPLGAGRVIALQAASELTSGDAPFDQISLVGSSAYLRGYTRGRFRDRDLAAVQAEYRAHLWRKFGWAAFAGAGRVSREVSGLVDGGARILPSYGLGLRRTLFSNSRSAIRVDYARGASGQSGLYVALNEAF